MTDFVAETCCRCGVVFGLPRAIYNDRKKRRGPGNSFWCPNGHEQHYVGATEEDKLRQERDRLKQRQAYLQDRIEEERQEAERQKRRAAAARGQVTKLKKRAKAGVCPCCNRHFQNLQSHMETKHPNFEPEDHSDFEVIEGGKSA